MNRCSQCQYVWPVIIYSWRSIIHLSAAWSVVYHFCDFLKPVRNNAEALSDKKLVNDEGFCLVSVPCLHLCVWAWISWLTTNSRTGAQEHQSDPRLQGPSHLEWWNSLSWSLLDLLSCTCWYWSCLCSPISPSVSLWWTLAGGVRWWCPLQSVLLQPHSLALWGPAEVLLSQ